jgi:glycosyltransferase involved in cell wall biosynthesis
MLCGGESVRVVMISKAYVVGAYQTKLEEMASAEDMDLTVVVPPSWREAGHTLALEVAHTKGYHLLITPVVWNGSFHCHFYPALPRLLRDIVPDICHIDEEPYNLATYLALRAARRVGAKTLFFTWQNLLRKYPFPFSMFERHVHQHVDAALAGNHDAVRVLRAKGYHGPVQVIPQFGVDPSIYSPRSERTTNGVFSIGYAGRLVEQKGLWDLLEAVSILSGDWRLLFYGAGPLREPLEQRAKALGLAQRVVFWDRVPSADLPDHLRGLDVLVLPSLSRPNWKEQFGRILVEAMACGVPVIGADSGEIPQVIGDGGLVFAEGDVLALSARLSHLRQNPALCRKLGARGRERVLAHYTQARIAAQTVAFYRFLLGDQAAISTQTWAAT